MHYLALNSAEVDVYRNDSIPFNLLEEGCYHGVVISPGPQRPEQAGQLMTLISLLEDDLPVLGICLGMQAMGLHLGLKLDKAPIPVHGKTTLIYHDGFGIYQDISSPTEVMRYHSLLLYPPFDDDIEPSGYTDDHLLMSFRHKSRPWEAVQFHPESIGTPEGIKMISNWMTSISASFMKP